MLKTLLKHEMRATAKTFIWLYIAFAAIAVVNTLVNPLSSAIRASSGAVPSLLPTALQGISMTLYILSLVAMGIVTLVIVILRFFRNLLGDEGYLMMTLPVSREQNILSKMLVAVFWNVCTCVLIILSFLLMIAGAGIFDEFTNLINQIFSQDAPVARWVAMFITAMVVAAFTGVLMLYAAMGIGPNLMKNRIGGSILAYILIYIVTQIIGVGVMWGAVSMSLGTNVLTPAAVQSSSQISNLAFASVDSVIIATIISEAAIGVGCWFLTRFMLTRKLNLA